MNRILLDTNIVLRLADRAASEHRAIRLALQKLDAQGVSLVLAPQVLIEFWVVATRPVDVNGFGWTTEIVGAAIARLRERFDLLAESPELFQRWIELVVQRDLRGKRAHDARLAAIALVHGVERILTFNVSDFSGIGGVAALRPEDVT